MRTLLLCVDGSSYGTEACKYAAWLAKRADARIITLYVSDLRQFEMPVLADLSGSLGVQPYQGIAAQLQEMEEEKAKAIEQQALDTLEQCGVGNRSTFRHHTGLLVDTLEDYQEEADLIILGKRGENANFASEHLGSTMERIVRASKKPVWVTNRKFREIRRLLLAYDGGKSCRKALDFLNQYKVFHELELHVVSVVEGNDSTEVSRKLHELEKSLRDAEYKPICQMLTGDPEKQIAQYVADQEMDMLLMGAYGHGRIRYLLIGSTTTEMIRRCQIPVLCFR